MPTPLSELEKKRDSLKEQIAHVGDMRLGSLLFIERKCGKPTCHCAKEGASKHPQVLLYRAGTRDHKARGRSIPKQALELTRSQVDECHRFQDLCQELMEVSEQICDLRLRTEESGEAGKKKPRRASAT